MKNIKGPIMVAVAMIILIGASSNTVDFDNIRLTGDMNANGKRITNLSEITGLVTQQFIRPDHTSSFAFASMVNAATNQGRAELQSATNQARIEMQSATNQSYIDMMAATNQSRIQMQSATNTLKGQLISATNSAYGAIAGATNLAAYTNKLWDIDTLTAPATVGSLSWEDAGSGDTENLTYCDVWPIYSNAIGRVFGSPMSDSRNEHMAYHRWTWPAQAGAVGYFVHVLINDTSEEGWREQAGTSIDVASAIGGGDIDPKPSTISRTNEVISSFYALDSNLTLYVPWTATGAFLHAQATNILMPWEGTNLFVPWPETNNYATLAAVASNYATKAESRTNQFWDVDVFTAPATIGYLSIGAGSGGGEFSWVDCHVYPIYSNGAAVTFGSDMSTNVTEAPAQYFLLGWTQQAAASAYYVTFTADGSTTYYTNLPASASSIALSNWGGAAWPSIPTSVATTNPVLSNPVGAYSAFLTNATPIPVDATNALPSVACDQVVIINGTNFTMIVGQNGGYVEVAPGCGIGPLGGISNANEIVWAGKDGAITNAIYRPERRARP